TNELLSLSVGEQLIDRRYIRTKTNSTKSSFYPPIYHKPNQERNQPLPFPPRILPSLRISFRVSTRSTKDTPAPAIPQGTLQLLRSRPPALPYKGLSL
ncbi:hypothetical protein C7212DRAFT_339557, partial [Tuber magnatum]